MAQPFIRTSSTILANGRTQDNKHYQSLDNTDEQLYDNLATLYEREAFIDAIETRLAEIAGGSEYCIASNE